MSSISFQELAVSASDLKQLAASGLSPSARLNPTARPFFASTGPMSPAIPISETSNPKLGQQTLFAEDTPASRSVSQVDSEGQMIRGISGRKCLELYKASGRDGSLPKMLLDILNSVSTRLPHHWMLKASRSGRLLFQLVPSMPRTDEIGSGFWPTPQAGSNNPAGHNAMSWDFKESFCKRAGIPMTTRLNPQFIEWLMGYPAGWTELERSATPSSRRLRRSSGKPS